MRLKIAQDCHGGPLFTVVDCDEWMELSSSSSFHLEVIRDGKHFATFDKILYWMEVPDNFVAEDFSKPGAIRYFNKA